MEKQFQQILKEQIAIEFHQKKLDSLIAFFMAKYSYFPYAELDLEHLTSDYLKVYDISFLAGYIRYSDLGLLESGVQDLAIKEKLCYLYYHTGTIKKAYRNFIWSNDITLDDIRKWLPLLCNIRLKDRIMKSSKITRQYKDFLDLCSSESSFAYQNLILLDNYYLDSFDISKLAMISNQEAFYKILKIVVENHIAISYNDLLKCFSKIQGLLEQTSISILSQYHFWLEEYLKNYNQFSFLRSLKELKEFCQFRTAFHHFFLIDEHCISSLKDFYCNLFIGLSYQEFENIFTKIPNDQSEPYQLLQELYNAKFPLSLKENLYKKFLDCQNLKMYFEKQRLKIEQLESLKLNFSLAFVEEERPIVTFQNSNFLFIISSIEDYENSNDSLVATIESDKCFFYQEECLVAYSDFVPLSYNKNTCIIKKQNLIPKFLIAFDMVSLKHLKYQKLMKLPIIVIDTELYAEKWMYQLQKMYADGDWISYMEQKKNFFLSIQNHPWLSVRFFTSDALYQDVKIWMEKLEVWINEKVPPIFIKKQLMVLKQLLSLDEELEMLSKKKKSSFQYRKKMLQYELITE